MMLDLLKGKSMDQEKWTKGQLDQAGSIELPPRIGGDELTEIETCA